MTTRSRPGSSDAAAAAAEGSTPKRLKSVTHDNDASQELLEAVRASHKPYQVARENAKKAREQEAKRKDEVDKASTELYKHITMLERTERLKNQKVKEVEKQKRLLEASEEELEGIEAAVQGHKFMVKSAKQSHDTAVLLLKDARDRVKIKKERVDQAETAAIGEAIEKLNDSDEE